MDIIKYKKGFTVVETALTTAFIAAAVAVVFIAYPKVVAEQKTQTEAKALTVITSNVSAIFKNSSDYTGLSVSSAIAGRMVPDSMVNGTSLRSEFGGNVIVQSASSTGIPANQDIFRVQYFDVSPEECVKLVSKVERNFLAIFAGTDTTTPDTDVIVNRNTSNPSYTTTPFSITNLLSRCNANNLNIVTFYHI